MLIFTVRIDMKVIQLDMVLDSTYPFSVKNKCEIKFNLSDFFSLTWTLLLLVE